MSWFLLVETQKAMKLNQQVWVTLTIATLSTASISNHARGQAVIKAKNCDFSKLVNLRTTTRYGIFGDDTFDTAVCGYLVRQVEERFGQKETIAYLRITQFQDEGFRRAIERGVAQGNTVNSVKNGIYDFSLGCFKGRRIEVDAFDPANSYLLPAVQQKLMNSSAEQPIALIFSFAKHPGSACICCNLADQVRLYEPDDRNTLVSTHPVFDPAKIRVGDRVSGLEVVATNIQAALSGGFTGSVRFRGEFKLSGRYVPNLDQEGHESVPCFFVDAASSPKLPRFPDDERISWFCFNNPARAKQVLGNRERSNVTIVINNYETVFVPSDGVNQATFVRVIKLN
jgi:hypothetical protein